MCMPVKMGTLKDRDMQIADCGENSHKTIHATDLCDVNESLQTCFTTAGAGARIGVTKVGTIGGSIYDKFGNIVAKNAILKDVVVVPE